MRPTTEFQITIRENCRAGQVEGERLQSAMAGMTLTEREQVEIDVALLLINSFDNNFSVEEQSRNQGVWYGINSDKSLQMMRTIIQKGAQS
jgi:hypothetical protein